MLKIKNRDKFFEDLEKVWTNAAMLPELVCLDLNRDLENTIHEYCHFVTLGLKTRRIHDPDVFDQVGSFLQESNKRTNICNEALTLAVELLIIESIARVDRISFVSIVLLADDDKEEIKKRVFNHLKNPKKLLPMARKVIRRIREHAKVIDRRTIDVY